MYDGPRLDLFAAVENSDMVICIGATQALIFVPQLKGKDGIPSQELSSVAHYSPLAKSIGEPMPRLIGPAR